MRRQQPSLQPASKARDIFQPTASSGVGSAGCAIGKSTGGFDFTYRLPLPRNWVTIYADSLADDDPSPLAAPRRAGVNPGVYITHFPALERPDLRVGGAINDGSIGVEYRVRPDWGGSSQGQYEPWKFPLLAPILQNNVCSSIQIQLWPQSHPK